MPRKTESRGTCAYCGETFLKRNAAKHLSACAKRLESMRTAESSNRPVERLWLLRVQDAYNKDFWLDLEMNGSASLDKLDRYLRAIWLECCDHLSQFTIDGGEGKEIAKVRQANDIFKPGLMLRHLYDFGTPSETEITAVAVRTAHPTTKQTIALLARNLPPEVACQECGQPATWLCTQCANEDDKPGYLCAEHVENHPHDDNGTSLRLVNSPRMGMCGYVGPAEPPY